MPQCLTVRCTAAVPTGITQGDSASFPGCCAVELAIGNLPLVDTLRHERAMDTMHASCRWYSFLKGTIIAAMKGDARSLDYASYASGKIP